MKAATKYRILYALWSWWHQRLNRNGVGFARSKTVFGLACGGNRLCWQTHLCNKLEHAWCEIEERDWRELEEKKP